jgi:hypothetical protein
LSIEDGVIALAAKRDALAAEIKRMRVDIKVLDSAIRVLIGNKILPIKKQQPSGIQLFGRKDIHRATLAALRKNPEGMAVPAVADAAMQGKAIDHSDVDLRRIIEHRVANTMSALKNKGVLVDGGEDESGRKIYRIAQ